MARSDALLQIFTVVSSDAVARRVPSGLKATARTLFACEGPSWSDGERHGQVRAVPHFERAVGVSAGQAATVGDEAHRIHFGPRVDRA